MAEKRGAPEHRPLSPLWSTGVGHAQVHAPLPGGFPDPMGYRDTNAHRAPWMTAGGGDNVNDWDAADERPRE